MHARTGGKSGMMYFSEVQCKKGGRVLLQAEMIQVELVYCKLIEVGVASGSCACVTSTAE